MVEYSIDWIYNNKPRKALIALYEREKSLQSPINSEPYTVTTLYKEINTTYAHTVNIISKMEDQGLIEKTSKKRKKVLSLTDKGKKLGEKMKELKDVHQKLIE